MRSPLQIITALLAVFAITLCQGRVGAQAPAATFSIDWEKRATIPDSPGLAGPFVGTHDGTLILAGGANFAPPVWENPKVWHDEIWRLDEKVRWHRAGSLPRKLGYGASVTIPEGVVCIGGNDGESTFSDVFLLRWDAVRKRFAVESWPELPGASAHGGAALIGAKIYVVRGQSDASLDSATSDVWVLDLAQRDNAEAFRWEPVPRWPGASRAFAVVTRQHNGYEDCLYVFSGRRSGNAGVEFLRDVWEFAPIAGTWRRRGDMPQCVMAGTAIDYGQSHVFVLGGADGANFGRANELKDDHPGFPKKSFIYHTITDTWCEGSPSSINQVTTKAVRWDGAIVVPSGEVRPRVRTPDIWRLVVIVPAPSFGIVNYIVLALYLLAIVAVGFVCARRNKTTDQYFRGGKHIPWWAAGCSIFATMLSSLTFTGIPSKAYAQDWVYAIGNAMIPAVAFVAVYLALPFYRRIDATSAYEYFEKRFGRGVRLFASSCFALFHVFRMAIVMSLTGLALSVATTLTPTQSVLLIGALSVLYSTMGGVEAVIWTDTIQAVVLLFGAFIAIVLLVMGTDGGVSGFVESAGSADKFRVANFNWDATSAQIAIWAIVLGGIGQNFSSYTADQAVVQRYMTTPDEKTAARAIWTNAVLTIPATLLFFGIGTALFAFYQSNPGLLDPSITTDQIFPLFIAREMPVGLAGLIVAGIFAAAQSTVSTSMNSTSTVIVTDFLRPFGACKTERGYLRAARTLTLGFGIVGTLLGLVFIDPEIKSLFDAFIMTIGMFMGVLGGLFALGAFTRRANGFGAMVGALAGSVVMLVLWNFTDVHGYLYTTLGIVACFVIGYVASLAIGKRSRDLSGLTIHTD